MEKHKILKFAMLTSVALFFVLYLSNFTVPEEKMIRENSYRYAIPATIDFCGESVPLDNDVVFESFDRENLINQYWHSRTIQVIKRGNKYFPIIEPILDSMGVPSDFKYLAVIESALLNATSPSGAKGIWQFLKTTARDYGLEVTDYVDERLHLEKSTVAACKYLLKSYEHLGNWALVAASYNMGLRGIKAEINDQGVKDYYQLMLNDETGRYVYRIIATKFIFENADSIGFKWPGMRMYELPELKSITVKEPIQDLRSYCINEGILYKDLKIYNPWLVNTSFRPKTGKTYYFLLPEKSGE